jgi:hypothetical protein
MTTRFFIMAHRSPDSIFGAAQAPAKDRDGSVVYYPTREEADRACDLLNRHGNSPSVFYTVEEETVNAAPAPEVAPEAPAAASDSMTYRQLATLPVGAVVVNTGVLESYPNYWIEPGARFVVVQNDLNEMASLMHLRIVPSDRAKMRNPADLAEWSDCVHIGRPADDGFEVEDEDWEQMKRCKPGADREDMIWDIARKPLVRRDEALALDARIAAVFAAMLEQHIGSRDMALVIERNRTPGYKDTDSCASHDFCDANMVMDATWRAMGLVPPADTVDGTPEHQEACQLWNTAWSLAKSHYFVAPKADVGDAEDEAVSAVPPPERDATAILRDVVKCWGHGHRNLATLVEGMNTLMDEAIKVVGNE